MLAMQGQEWAIDTLLIWRPQPPQYQQWKGRREMKKKVEDYMGAISSCQKISIGAVLKTSQSHTIKYGVTKIVPQRLCICNNYILATHLNVKSEKLKLVLDKFLELIPDE